MSDIFFPSQIVVQTAAAWAVDATVYSSKKILITSDAFYTGTDQHKLKLGDGVQTWANLDYFDPYVYAAAQAAAAQAAAQSYADSLVVDAINNGVTDSAPSQNAVFDALALKKDTFEIYMISGQSTLNDSSTYYFGDALTAPSVTAGNYDFNLGFAFTIIGCVISVTNTVSGSAETSTLKIHNVTQATDDTIGEMETNGTSTVAKYTTFTGLNIAVAANDFIEMELATPVLATNPTAVRFITRLICQKT